MSARPRLAQLATDAMARTDASTHEPAARPTPLDASRAIAAISVAIAARARSRRRLRFGAACAAALLAACFVAAFGFRRGGAPSRSAEETHPAPASPPPSPAQAPPTMTITGHAMAGAVVVVRAGPDKREETLERGIVLAAGDRVVAGPDGLASVSLSTGTHLVLEADADLVVLEQGPSQVFELRKGSVRADVAKLAPGERFVVRTDDAEVEVHGTSFRVTRLAETASLCAGSRTRVTVAEGVVAVRDSGRGREDYVRAGEQWPRGCTPSPVRSALPASAASQPAPLASAKESSDLADQNRLFAEASAARRRGDAAAAIAGYERLIARYPASHLAETAAVERMRALAKNDRALGAEAARGYLSLYPSGFARAEAAALAESPR